MLQKAVGPLNWPDSHVFMSLSAFLLTFASFFDNRCPIPDVGLLEGHGELLLVVVDGAGLVNWPDFLILVIFLFTQIDIFVLASKFAPHH